MTGRGSNIDMQFRVAGGVDNQLLVAVVSSSYVAQAVDRCIG
jgi:hypothetical protein